MVEVLRSIDNREISVCFWVAVLFGWGLSKQAVRRSFAGVLKALTVRSVTLTFGLAAAYLAVITYALSAVQAWTLQQFKISILWFLVAGIPALMDIPRISEDPGKLAASAAKNFKLSLLLDFAVNLFKMPLVVELFFIPFTALLGGLLGVAQSNEKYAVLEKFLYRILILLGGALLAFALYMLTSDFGSVANSNTARDFGLPIFYNLAFLPVLWMLAVYAAYDSVFARIRFVVADESLRVYAKRRLLLSLRTDIRSLNKWLKQAWSTALTSRKEVERSIQAVKEQRNAA